jgi:3-hydroxyisobutyrate dehydrogenase-like beta-hydroxyacid dehydrogenase
LFEGDTALSFAATKTTEMMSSNNGALPRITVLGAGSMGITLARLYHRAGYRVSIWNRTAARTEGLPAGGIQVPETLTAAIEAGDVILVCVLDYAATNAILSADGVAASLKGKTLVQLSTGSPKEARALNSYLQASGVAFLAGALQVAPEQMAQPDTTILLSGDEAVFRGHKTTLDVMGGNIQYLGEDISLASAMDLATLSAIYGTLIGFFHGAASSAAAGFDVTAYAGIVAATLPSFAGFLKHEAAVIQSGDYRISQSPLSISIGATQRILEAADESGLNNEFPRLAAALLSRAGAAGYAGEELAAMVKILRANTVSL